MTTDTHHPTPVATLERDPRPGRPPASPTPDGTVARASRDPQRLARLAGLLYLGIFVAGLFSEAVVRGGLVHADDATGTLADIAGSPGLYRAGIVADLVMVVCDVALAVVLFRLFAPVSRLASMAASAFRLVQSAILGTVLVSAVLVVQLVEGDGILAGASPAARDDMALQALELHRIGYLVALVPFAVSLGVFAWLVLRSRYLPRAIGWLLAAGAAGYLADTGMALVDGGYDGSLSPIVLAPAVVAELATLLWLLVRGVDVEGGAAR